ncbi:MAG TPA: hypothetical protein VG818_10960 [Gemmatimonadaceae bacterium]|nr:hypothetical protein [Gemmatimonadaceae bacterium]
MFSLMLLQAIASPGPHAAGIVPRQDTAIVPDTTAQAVVHTPLPGGVGAFVRAVFNQPPWLQVTAVVVGVLVALAIVAWLWTRRRDLIHWIETRSRGWKMALVAAAFMVAFAGVGFGMASWHYAMHNNDFCIGCHVMNSAWTRFQHSEHRKLQCHDCHQQSIFASMRQLYLWVAERPAAIPPHAKVPTQICLRCHNQAQPDSVWKRILATAGHSVHLHNDKPALRNIQCVTCHGAEIHHFVPVDKTCGQSGCHNTTRIQLGKMAGQTSLHCTGCHNFTQPVAANISPDSARVSLIPTQSKCLDCHAMQKRLQSQLASLDPKTEPHHAVCGSCHDPHKQATTKDAFRSCATAQCHARADTLTPFHRGLPDNALANCGSCHKAHVWKVESKACTACHRNLDGGTPHVASPHRAAASPAAADAGTAAPSPAPHELRRPGPSVDEATWQAGVPPLAPAAQDTTKFRHDAHRTLACRECHSSENTHGAITVKQPEGCRSCHHATTQAATCTTCHRQDQLPNPTLTQALTMSVWPTPRSRALGFDHARHTTLACRTCHTAPSTLAPERTCASCHAQHHVATATCASCHPPTALADQRMHPRVETHAGCGGSGCHADAAVRALPPTRNVCLACHRDKATHQPGGDCATCHMLGWSAQPAAAGGGHR